MENEGLSPTDIARALGRSLVGVQRAIKRLKVKPLRRQGKRLYYSRKALDKLSANMRRKNREPEARC